MNYKHNALTSLIRLDFLLTRWVLSAFTTDTACEWNAITSLSCPGQGARYMELETITIYSDCTAECSLLQANITSSLESNILCNHAILYLIAECHGTSDCFIQSALINRYMIDSSADNQLCTETLGSGNTAIKARITYNCKRVVNDIMSNKCRDNIATTTEQSSSQPIRSSTIRVSTTQSVIGRTTSSFSNTISAEVTTSSESEGTTRVNHSISTTSMYYSEDPELYFWPTTTTIPSEVSTMESSAPDSTKLTGSDTDEADGATKAVIIVTCTLASVILIAGLIMLAVFLNHRKQRLRRQRQLEMERKCEPMRDFALIVDFRQESGVGAVTSPDYDYPVTRDNCMVCLDRGHKQCQGHKRHSLQKMDFNFLRPDGYYERMGNRDDRHVYSELGMSPASCTGPGRAGKISTVEIDSVQAKPLPVPEIHYAYLKDSTSGSVAYQQESEKPDHIYEELPAHRM